MRPMSYAFFLAASAVTAACGGRVDEPDPANMAGSNQPTSTPPPASGSCAGACERFRDCAAQEEDDASCVRSCDRNFPDSARAQVWASCIDALSCETIKSGLYMSYGPIGECYSLARRR